MKRKCKDEDDKNGWNKKNSRDGCQEREIEIEMTPNKAVTAITKASDCSAQEGGVRPCGCRSPWPAPDACAAEACYLARTVRISAGTLSGLPQYPPPQENVGIAHDVRPWPPIHYSFAIS